MIKIDKELEKRVSDKRDLFLSKIKGIGLKETVINEIKQLSYSMEKANILGDKELALHYKEQIKETIAENY